MAIADTFLPYARSSRLASGILDETAHLATGIVALLALGGRDSPFARGLIAGSVLIDVDHLPDALGHMWLRAGSRRPYPHTLLTPVAAMAVARRARGRERRWSLGAAAGMTLHLIRDLASGQGTMLLWPASRRNFRLRYPAYVALLAVMAAAPRPARAGQGAVAPPNAW
ncbi:MAG: inner membrane protein [Thermoleophilaceae bacterium]|nr:inner membrane protein [Thermoleophilaceae bacterium]